MVAGRLPISIRQRVIINFTNFCQIKFILPLPFLISVRDCIGLRYVSSAIFNYLRLIWVLQFRHVIVVGDLNVSHRRIDHCDPDEVDYQISLLFFCNFFRVI